ncbi:MAG: hypothetical protein RMM08_00880 [Armatimonadota bacterium]|nr:hypothetical protein [bacterium]MDW8319888.1 hypothetical protein [Armatimonadota bacterium]
MANEVSAAAGGHPENSLAPVTHHEFYTATDGSQWLMEIDVQWFPHFEGRVRLLKMPERVPIHLPANLPYLEVVPKDIREAVLDGRFDPQAVTRYYLQRCLVMLREYVERFGSTL